MKIGVYSCMTPDLVPEQLISLLHKIGYDVVEWTIGYTKAVYDPYSQWHIREDHLDEDIPRFRDLSARYQIPIVCLGANVSLFETDRLQSIFTAASKLECPRVRIFSPGYTGHEHYDRLIEDVRRALPKVIAIGRDTGVHPLLETHMGTIIPSASAARRLLEGFSADDIGVVYDPGNMIQEGYENWQMGIEILGPYISHVHIKNYTLVLSEQSNTTAWQFQPVALDDGLVNFSFIVSTLLKYGYNRALCVEDFRGGYGCRPIGIRSEQKLSEDFDFLASLLKSNKRRK